MLTWLYLLLIQQEDGSKRFLHNGTAVEFKCMR